MTALLHYFFLATFTWTLCEAVLVYILLVKVFGANERKWIYLYLALVWGEIWMLQCYYVCIASTSSSEGLFLQSLTSLFCSSLVHEWTNFHWFLQELLILWFIAFCCHPSVLPIPVVVITGGARHDYYLIRASFDQSHPHYNSIKA